MTIHLRPPILDDPNAVTSGELVPPDRFLAYANAGVALMSASQRMNLHYFTAQKTEPITQIETATGATAAGATPTLCRVGVFSIAANGDGTLLAAIANDTAMWATIGLEYLRALTTTFNKVAGQRYAVGALCVTAAALPVLVGPTLAVATTSNNGMALAPRIGGAITGQADLPATFLAASVVASRFIFTARFVP